MDRDVKRTDENLNHLLLVSNVLAVLALDGLGGTSLAVVNVGLVVLEHLSPVLVAASDSGLSVKEIDLLEGETLSLGNAEVGEEEASDTSRSPNEEDLDTKVGGPDSVDTSCGGVDQVGSSVSDTKVPEPVGRGRHGHGLSSDSKREDFSGDDPGDRTPSGSEGSDVDANESDENSLGGDVDGTRSDISGRTGGDTNNGNDELANSHDDSSAEKHRSSTGSIDHENTGNSANNVDDVGDDSDDEGVRDTGSSEEGRAVVEDEVDTGQLLPTLDEDTGPGSEAVSGLSRLEAINVRGLAESKLSLKSHGDVKALLIDLSRVGRPRREPGESLSSLDVSTLEEKVSGGFGKEEHATREDSSPSKLDGNRDPPSRVVRPVLRRLVDDSGEKKTDGDGPLVHSDDHTTESFRRTFTLVHGNEATDGSNSESRDDTTDNKGSPSSRALKSDTDTEDSTSKDQTKLSTKSVSDGVGSESTKEGTSRKNRNDKRLVTRGQVVSETSIVRTLAVSTKGLKPILHGNQTTDGSGIETEQDSTEGRKGGHNN